VPSARVAKGIDRTKTLIGARSGRRRGALDLSPSQCAFLGERADLLGEVLDLALESFTHVGPDDAEFVHDQTNTR
jgi:hypothetical protein